MDTLYQLSKARKELITANNRLNNFYNVTEKKELQKDSWTTTDWNDHKGEPVRMISDDVLK